KENQKDLGNITLKELETYVAEGHFPAGSMGPKVQAAIKFLKAGGAKVIITNPDNLGLAVDGKAGTHITA
ncbi:carbamate kinase, partial [Myxococcota bacterium]|nr:carbamate kinase [Myxococcota bacterium]